MAKIITSTIAEKTFTVAGVSDLNGVYKLRVANSTSRYGVLHRNGHLDIRLIELPHAMTKLEATDYLMGIPTNKDIHKDDKIKTMFIDDNAQQAFADFYAKVKVTAPVIPTAEESDDAIDLAALEAEIAADEAELMAA